MMEDQDPQNEASPQSPTADSVAPPVTPWPTTAAGPPQPAVWPPPPAGYQHAGTQLLVERFLSPRPLALWIYVGLSIYSLIDFTSLGFDLEGRAGKSIATILDTVSTVPVLGTFLLLLIWTHRAYGNLKTFGATGLSATPGLAVGYHFIPLLALYKPFLIYNEIARASDPRSSGLDREARRRGRTAPAIYLWWLLYIIRQFISVQYLQSTFQSQQTQGDIPLITWLGLIENLALASVVYTITKRQDEKARSVSQNK